MEVVGVAVVAVAVDDSAEVLVAAGAVAVVDSVGVVVVVF